MKWRCSLLLLILLATASGQTVRAEKTSGHDRIIRKIPGVRMRWIDPAERGEELAGFELQIKRQTRRLQERFFDFDLGLVVVVELEHNVGESFEVGIDCAVEGQLDVARVEPALLRIVVANFYVVEVARARVSQREQSIE